jgi:CheY-like chemotaxis protein
MMPDLDGWAFRAEQLATPALADVPVIVLSAARNRQAEALGSAAVVAKPATFRPKPSAPPQSSPSSSTSNACSTRLQTSSVDRSSPGEDEDL